MPRKSKVWWSLCNRGAQFCGHCCLSFFCWSLWLGLSLLAAAQIYVAVSHQLPVPTFIVNSLEKQLVASGITVDIGRTSFDPTGRILIEDATFSLSTFEEPVAQAKLIYLHLDPWDLLVGDFSPQEFHASGVNLHVPAMLSATGRSEDVLHDITVSAHRSPHGLTLDQFTAKLATLTVTAQGGIDLRSLRKTQQDSLPLAELLVRNYSKYCRTFEKISPYLTRFDTPQLHLELRESSSLGAIAKLTLRAQGIKKSFPVPLITGPFAATTRIPLWFDQPVFARINAEAETIHLPQQADLEKIRATFQAQISRDAPRFNVSHTILEIGSIHTKGVTVSGLSADIDSRDFPLLDSRAVAMIGTEPVQITGQTDTQNKSARFHASGRFDPELMEVINQQTGHNIRRFLDFGQAPYFDLDLDFSPGAKFDHLVGHIFGRDVYTFRGVVFDEIGGHVSFDGKDFIATDAAARIGDNFATGSYIHDITNQEFRFLLDGRLNPPDIGAWFRSWWPNFWSRFDFSAGAPLAEVDVQGRWRHGPETSVFVYANSRLPVLRGVKLEQMATRIFVRPHYYDAMDLIAVGQSGVARGSFIRKHIPYTPRLDSMSFSFQSTLPAADAAGLAGDEVTAIVAPFSFTQNPSINISGVRHGENSVVSPRLHVELHGHTEHPFTFHDFPLTSTSFSAVLNDNDLLIEPITLGFAQGLASGKMRLQGASDNRRLGFDLNLKDANLREASVILDHYFALRRNETPSATSKYVEQTAQVFAQVGLSAEGDPSDPLSFHGTGSASLEGPGLGEIRLLGLLSHLINFTALDFTRLDTNFTLAGDSLDFPEVSLTGPNAAISAHGSYALEGHSLDFNARIFPFQESKFVLKSVMGAVLSPLSNVLEVKLTGNLSKPSWAFVMGPTNFFRSLSKPSENTSSTGTSSESTEGPE